MNKSWITEERFFSSFRVSSNNRSSQGNKMFQSIIQGLGHRLEKDATACRIYSESLNGIFLSGNMAVNNGWY
jgi:hypothetical protein